MEVYERIWEIIESSRFDRLGEVLTEDCFLRSQNTDYQGLDAIGEYFQGAMTPLPDLRHKIINVLVEDDRLAAEVLATATHTGPLALPTGTVEPTGNPIVMEAVDFLWFREGRVCRWIAYVDQLALIAQLGLLPSAGA